MENEPDVFISHASPDVEAANRVCAYLEEKKLKCWIAPRDISEGEKWAGAISGAVRKCKVVVLILSQHTDDSEYVKDELDIARKVKKRIITFRIREVFPTGELETYLGRFQYLNAFARPFEEYLASLHAAVLKQLNLAGGRVEKTGGGEPEVRKGLLAGKSWLILAAGILALLFMGYLWANRGASNPSTNSNNAANGKAATPTRSPTPTATPIAGDITGVKVEIYTGSDAKDAGEVVTVTVGDSETGEQLLKWEGPREKWDKETMIEFTKELPRRVPLAQCGRLEVVVTKSLSPNHDWKAGVVAKLVVNGKLEEKTAAGADIYFPERKHGSITLKFACP